MFKTITSTACVSGTAGCRSVLRYDALRQHFCILVFFAYIPCYMDHASEPNT